jgi:hypothetical protein
MELMVADLLCIHPHQVDEFWPYAEPVLKRATERCGNWSIGELKREIEKGALLWIVWDGKELLAACVTRLAMETRGLILMLLPVQARGRTGAGFTKKLKTTGATRVAFSPACQGRDGWRRIFSDYDLAWVTLEKRLDS